MNTRRAVPALVVSSAFIGLVALLMYLTARNDDDAANYISVLATMVSWPALIFSIALIALLMFSEEIAYVIRNIRKVAAWNVSAEVSEQADKPSGDRPIELPAEDTDVISGVSAVLPDSIPLSMEELGEFAQVIENFHSERIAALELEAKRWWHRYLAVFLSPKTIQVLEHISTTHAIVELPPKREELRLLHPDGSVYPIHREDFDKAIEVLEGYDLIRKVSLGGWDWTDAGREFVEFLRSEDGRLLLMEIRESRQVNPYAALGGY